MMLQLDVIQQLDLIAYEGWEYHKLSLETLDLVGSRQSNRGSKALASVRFQAQTEGTHLDQNRTDIAAPAYFTRDYSAVV